MGLFDSKKTKQERELYQTLLKESKNCWGLAQDIGNFNEKEFIKPSNQNFVKMKQDIIDKYMLVMEIIKNNDLKTLKMNPQKGFQFLPTKTIYEHFKSRYDLTTFNGCYSLLREKASLYEYFKSNNNGSVIDFLQSYDEINSAFLDASIKKEEDKFKTQIKKGEDELECRLADLSRTKRQLSESENSQSRQNQYNWLQEETASLYKDMYGKDYPAASKFNQSKKKTQAEFDAMGMSERDKLIHDLNKNMEDINSNKGRRGR